MTKDQWNKEFQKHNRSMGAYIAFVIFGSFICMALLENLITYLGK